MMLGRGTEFWQITTITTTITTATTAIASTLLA